MLVFHEIEAEQDQRNAVGLVDAKVITQVLKPFLMIVTTKVYFEFVERLVVFIFFFTIWIINLESEGHLKVIYALDLLSEFGIVVTHLKFGADNSQLVFTPNYCGFEIDSFCYIRYELRGIVLGLQVDLCLAREILVLLEHVSELYGLYLVSSIFKWQHFDFILLC